MDSGSVDKHRVIKVPQKERKWLRRLSYALLGFLILLLVLYIATPSIVSMAAPSYIVKAFEREIEGTATVSEVRFSWGGDMGVSGLEVEDKSRAFLFQVFDASVKTSIPDAITGDYHAEVVVKDVVLRVGQDADGNLLLPKRREPDRARRERDREHEQREPKPKKPLPELSGKFHLENCRIILRDAAGNDTTLATLTADAALPNVDSPATFRVNVAGVARASLEGEATFARNRIVEPDAFAGHFRYELERTLLAELPAALLAAAGIEARDGALQGKGEVSFRAPGEVVARGGLELTSLHVNRKGKPEEEVKLGLVSLSIDANTNAQGTGTAQVKVRTDDTIEATLVANASTLAEPTGSANVTWESRVLFAPLAEAAGRFLHVKSGYTLDGTSTQSGRAEIVKEGGVLKRATVEVDGKIQDFAARDTRGAAMRFEREYTLALRAAFEPHKEAVLDRLDLKGGKLSVEGRGAVGLEPFAIRESSLDLDADLDELARQLSTFLELPISFGGKAKGSLTATGTKEAAKLACTAKLAGLELRNREGKQFGPIDLDFQSAAALDLAAEGALSLEKFSLESDFAQVSLSGSAKRFRGERVAERIEPDLKYAVSLQPEAISRRFGGFSPELARLRGATASIAGTITRDADGRRPIRFAGEVTEPNFQLPAASANDIAIELEGIRVQHDVAIDPLALDPASIAALARECMLAVDRITLSGGKITQPIALREFGMQLKGEEFRGEVRLGDGEMAQIAARMTVQKGGAVEVADGKFRLPGVSGEFSANAAPAEMGAKVAVLLTPERLNAYLAKRLSGFEIAGSEARGSLELSHAADRIHAAAQLKAPRLELRLPPTDGQRAALRRLAQEEMQLDLDVEVSLAKGKEALNIAKGEYRSKTATATLAGHVRNFEAPDADLTLSADGELARMLQDFGAFVPAGAGVKTLSGTLHIESKVSGTSGAITANGNAEITNLAVEAEIGEEKKKFAWQEPKLSIAHRASYRSEEQRAEIEELSIASQAISGRMTGRVDGIGGDLALAGGKGDFTYSPERADGILRPWLPARLEGAESKRVSFEMSGRLLEQDPWKLLEGLTGKADVELPTVVRDKLRAEGKSALVIGGGKVTSDSDLVVNGGTAKIGAAIDVRQQKDASSKITIEAKQVGASAELVQLLSKLHPMFGVAENRVDGMINGKIDAVTTLEHSGPIRRDRIAAGWKSYPKEPVNGKGNVAIGDFTVNGTPLFENLLGILNLQGRSEVDFQPLTFTIARGRVTYDRPMRMRIAKIETSWTGSVGLDETLDLAWEIPVTAEMLAKHKFLEYVGEKKLAIPIRGTARNPDIGWGDLAANLAKQAAAKEGGGLIEKGLEGLLGGGEKNDEAQKLLEQADGLWQSGKKADAKAIYLKIIDKYKKTQTYKQNKDRIRERAAGN